MKNKFISFIVAASLFAGGVLTGKVFTAVNAGSWDGLVYSINGASGDANGNVNVSAVNGHTVNLDVPASADFAQYDQNTTDIAAIENKLGGLTATAENVASGYTFVGSGGNVATGTMNASSNTYSTDETIIGTWIDGKPIYRRVFTGLTFMTVTNTYTAINGISAVGVKQIIRATALRTFDGLMVNTFDMKVNNNQFVYQHPNYTYDNCDTLIVEYTKTTD